MRFGPIRAAVCTALCALVLAGLTTGVPAPAMGAVLLITCNAAAAGSGPPDGRSLCRPGDGADSSVHTCGLESSLRGAAGDFLYILKAPARTSKTGAAIALTLAGVTTGLVTSWDETIDEGVRRGSEEFPHVVVRKLGELGHEYGKSDTKVALLFGGLSGAMLAGGLILDDKKLICTTALMAESFAFTVLVTVSVKMIVSRDRPYLDNGPHAVQYFRFSSDRAMRSMFSGHAATAFAMMTVIAQKYPSWWVRVPAYAFAAGASLRRIDSRQHWASDVLVGAALGYFIASRVVAKHSLDRRMVHPVVSSGRIGLALQF